MHPLGLSLWTTTLGLLPSLTVASAPHVENLQSALISQNKEGVFKAMFATVMMCEEVVDHSSSTSAVTGGRRAIERTKVAGIFFGRGPKF